MIGREEIDETANRLKVNPSDVQRDYIHGWLLAQIFQNEGDLASHFVLKGGNSLRKAYFEGARYSRDLDFSTGRSWDKERLARELNEICDLVGTKTGVKFRPERTRVADKKLADRSKSVAECRLYFHDFYGKESEVVVSVRLDISEFDRLYLPVQTKQLIHPYSDSEMCRASIRCAKLEEVLASKMRCLLQRNHVADLFDLAYATLLSGDLEVNRRELLSTFFRITVFGATPGVAKALFIDLPLEGLKRSWEKFISCPAGSFVTFDQAVGSMTSLIESILPEEPIREGSKKFFASALRNPIMKAGQDMTTLRLMYKSQVRLVEPYSLKFKIRKDGVGREYLYAYNRTGGSSSPGIRSFIPGKMQWIKNTDETFQPRWEVELSKAGSRESVGQFKRTSGLGSSRDVRPYRVRCNYCYRVFPRKKPSTRMRPHKNKYGNDCPGRRGTRLQ